MQTQHTDTWPGAAESITEPFQIVGRHMADLSLTRIAEMEDCPGNHLRSGCLHCISGSRAHSDHSYISRGLHIDNGSLRTYVGRSEDGSIPVGHHQIFAIGKTI